MIEKETDRDRQIISTVIDILRKMILYAESCTNASQLCKLTDSLFLVNDLITTEAKLHQQINDLCERVEMNKPKVIT